MEVQAVEKYIRISPKKARLVADVVRGEKAVNALAILRFMPKKAAKIIYKALYSAVANATNNAGLNKEDLFISKITIDNGPSLKRFRPRSKGMASALLKRTSHITVVVSDNNEVKSIKEKIKSTGKSPKEAKKDVTSQNKEPMTNDVTTEGSK